MLTLTIKLPLHKPTKIKENMYLAMQELFSSAANNILFLKKQGYSLRASDLDKQIAYYGLPSTLVQEARKLGVSRFADWKKHQKIKGFPSFRTNGAVPFNNQNWQLRFDGEYLKVGIPTLEPGNLTTEKYVPAATNAYSLFWARALLGTLDTTSKYFPQGMHSLKKGSAQLLRKNKRWFFAFTLSFEVAVPEATDHAIGVDRGLRMIAVCGDASTGRHQTFSGKHMGHVRRKYHRLRKRLQKAKNIKALKKLNNKEQRVITNANHVIAKRIVEFTLACRASQIKLEDLSGIRNMKRYWKRTDRNIHSWAFFDLEQKITYKAAMHALRVAHVDPYKTSQECSVCGLVLKKHRQKEKYHCSCGFHEHADVNASFVISKRPLKLAG